MDVFFFFFANLYLNLIKEKKNMNPVIQDSSPTCSTFRIPFSFSSLYFHIF